MSAAANSPEVFEVFQNAQGNSVEHRACVKAARKLRSRLSPGVFERSFANAIRYAFTFGDANGNVDRVLQFVAAFAASLPEDDPLQRRVFELVFECASVAGQGVRARSCQLLAALLADLGDDASLDADVCDGILAAQLDRLQDVRSAVRTRAVLTLQRLQDPSDENDRVTKAYAFHMANDPSASVRRAVVAALAKTSRNLLHVLERLCDVDESVRRLAHLYVSAVNVTQLKVRQRIHVLKVGFADRSPRVRRVLETVTVPGWLGTYGGNALHLLAALRLDDLRGAGDSASVTAALLLSLFRSRRRSELLEWLPADPRTKLIPSERLDRESARYLRHLVRFLHSEDDADGLDSALPELVSFVGYVREAVRSPSPPSEARARRLVALDLLDAFAVYDAADEAGRRALQSLVYETLIGPDFPLDRETAGGLSRVARLVLPDVRKRIEFFAGIVAEIQEPAEEARRAPDVTVVESDETKLLRAGLRVSLNEALEEQEEAVRAQDFALAALCKQKVADIQRRLEDLALSTKEKPPEIIPETAKEKKTDSATINRCLLIINSLLDTPQITSLTPVLRSLFENFEPVLFEDADIRENSLRTVALYSTLDEEFAKDHKAFFFTQFLNLDDENLVVTSLECVFDIMCVHGVDVFNVPVREALRKRNRSKTLCDTGTSTPDFLISAANGDDDDDSRDETYVSPSTQSGVIDLFLKLMNGESTEYRRVIVEGFCRLLMSGRLSSSSLVGHLLLLWYNPATEDEDELRQVLGTFFPLFASNVEDAQEQLENAFLPTIFTLLNAPANSPLSQVDPEGVIKFMAGLTTFTVSPAAVNVHSNLCIKILNVLEKGDESSEFILCKTLSLLKPPRSVGLCQDLLRSAEDLSTLIKEKTSYRYMSKFKAVLAIAIESMTKRTSENPEFDRISDILLNNVSSSTNVDADVDRGVTTSEEVVRHTETDNDEKRNSETNSVDTTETPPPKRVKSTRSDGSRKTPARPPRTPRNCKKLNTANSSKRVTSEQTPKRPSKAKSGKRAKRTVSEDSGEEEEAKSEKKRVSCIVPSSSSSSSDEDTVLHTIRHESEEEIESCSLSGSSDSE